MSVETLRPLGVGPPLAAPASRPAEDRPAQEAAPAGLVSIVLPAFGQLEMIRLCLPRLLRHSRSPFEVVVVDSGSMDGTADYLAGVGDVSPARIHAIRSEDDLDLGAACAQGLAQARGGLVVLLANDALVPEGWLNHLTGLVRLAGDVGVVGAMSNLAPPPQWVDRLPYRLPSSADATSGPDLAAVDRFAREWRDKHRAQSFEAERLAGPCLLFRAEVLKKIDLASCVTAFGALDGDRLGAQVRQAGYRLACCQDLFVHHFGTRPFMAVRLN